MKRGLQMMVSGKPFHDVAIECVGPFKLTRLGNQYVATVTDRCTKWAIAVLVRSIDGDLTL